MKQFLKPKIQKAKLLVAFLLIATIANAQEKFTISGKVVDKQETIPGASIVIKGTKKGTSTDLNGNFSLKLKKGTYTLVVSALSEPKEVKVNLTKNTSITIDLSNSFLKLDEVLVSAVRVKATSPVTHSNVSKKELAKRNLGQDIPILVNYLPSVVTTSDAGAGVGYTGIRVRGSDASRVNVTINGIPYNDAESQGTFWVNMPDFTSSVENLQLQRGVGTSTNGSGAFGASLNLLTDAVSEEAYGEISSAVGSYNTFKNTIKFSTGKIKDHIEISGRVSKIDSDGYIDRAWSDLKSYFLQAAYVDDNTLIKALAFGGHEKTYQAWYGVTKDEMETLGRTHNPYTYKNEIDNYKQNHFQLHWNQKLSDNWSTNIGLNYTKGKGYFEQFKEGEDFSFYNIAPVTIDGETIDETDLIRRRWLDNDFYVANLNATYKKNKVEFIFGGSISDYSGDHFGEVIWAEYPSNSSIDGRYYESDSKKTDANIFGKLTYELSDKWTLFTDIQGRFINYNTGGLTSDKDLIDVDKDFSFFNPKAGVTFKASDLSSFYASYAKAHREPNRNDFENGVDKAEKLDDFELGWRYKNDNVQINTNAYYMHYKDQLVLTGALDDVGAPIRATSGKSYRLGLEVDALFKIGNDLIIQPNIAISSNKNVDFFAPINGVLTNLGTTDLSFSPELVFGNAFTIIPTDNLQFSLLSKFVGQQQMSNLSGAVSNTDLLRAYFVNDLNITYKIIPNKLFKSITLNALINNIFNERYISNGYYYTYDDTWSSATQVTTIDGAGYYPQATRNFLVGATFRF
ncbi:iron complex outermembrane recepter protein [Lutibacter oricola]|uniref:Iron complex outermembrane recepter protein n=1 Tax=Lutibacter oricola TaxID=762486 RepID=A0A1H3EHB8_9FLAO|nr:TonB-dependent receptor [Lutibacter oricola]SDX77997.1 iron complex outermembrane recepter protein [Lutibacter oricola]